MAGKYSSIYSKKKKDKKKKYKKTIKPKPVGVSKPQKVIKSEQSKKSTKTYTSSYRKKKKAKLLKKR